MNVTNRNTTPASGDAMSEAEDKDAYTVGWICALPLEMAAAKLMLDYVYDIQIDQDEADHNSYILGLMRGHKMVIACLPDGVYGTTPAATVAKDMLRTFKSIRFGLLVGVGGGAPSLDDDIRLGDVVVSKPTGTNGGVIQYDRGKTKEHEFERTGSLNAPPNALLTALSRLQARQSLGESDIPQFLSEAAEKIKKPKIRRKYRFQGESNDHLFRAEYEHVNADSSCDDCDLMQTIQREDRDDTDPVVHYGNIASGNQVIKHGKTRDRLSKQLGILCFEMEAAGLMQEFPCLVIRGICDYSDSHKNKRWQQYASITAAAFAKELLSVVAPSHVKKENLIRLDTRLSTLISNTNNAIQHQTQKQEHRHEEFRNRECLHQLCQTDPKKDRLRIIGGRDGNQSLFEASYAWILTLPEFRRWRTHPQSRRLWVRGGPGKGKTMLLCGIIEKLEKSNTERLCYFFCQATVPALNNATSVLRGLMYQLVQIYPWLLTPVLAVYNAGGKDRFEDHNAWETMSELFVTILSDPCMDGVLLIVDALDECVTDRLKLLGIIQKISEFSLARIIVSSRKWAEIDEMLGSNNGNASTIALELHDSLISRAVQSYIEQKVTELADRKKFDSKTCAKIEAYLRKESQETFLWVALVCQELFEPGIQGHNVMKVVATFPPGLDALYTRMMKSISSWDTELFEETLAVVSVLRRPVTAEELLPLIQSPLDGGMESLEQAITSWGSFFNIQDRKIYFVHQSAVEFLRSEASGLADVTNRHRDVFLVSLEALQRSKHIKRDIYALGKPDVGHAEISRPYPDPLSALRYCCVYWIDHLVDWAVAGTTTSKKTFLNETHAIDKVRSFLEGKFLYWIEALALIRHMPQAVQAIQKLKTLIAFDAAYFGQGLVDFIHDAYRFLLYHGGTIESFPLQVYSSALVFSPQQSVVKNQFRHETPEWVTFMSGIDETWNECLQTLEGHRSSVQDVAYSADGQWLVSGDNDGTVKVWHANSGTCLRTIPGFSNSPLAGDRCLVGFSPDSKFFASLFSGGTFRMWNRATGNCVRELKVRPCLPANQLYAVTMAISSDTCTIACASQENDIVVWSVGTKVVSSTLRGHTGLVYSAALTLDGEWLASASLDGLVMIWNTLDGTHKQIAKSNETLHSITWLNGEQSIAVSCGSHAQILEVSTGKPIWKLECNAVGIKTFKKVTLSADERFLAIDSVEYIYIWNITTGALAGKISLDLGERLNSTSFSPDSQRIVTASRSNKSLKVWDTPRDGEIISDTPGVWGMASCLGYSDKHLVAEFGSIRTIRRPVAAFGSIPTIKILDKATACDVTCGDSVSTVACSRDNQYLALVVRREISIWNTKTGARVRDLDKDESDFLKRYGYNEDDHFEYDWEQEACDETARQDTEFERKTSYADAISRIERDFGTSWRDEIRREKIKSIMSVPWYERSKSNEEIYSPRKLSEKEKRRPHKAGAEDGDRKEDRREDITSVTFRGNIQLASNHHGKMWIWNTSKSTCTQSLESENKFVEYMRFSPDGRWLVYIYHTYDPMHGWTGTKCRVAFRNMGTKKCISTSSLPGTSGVKHVSMSFSADGRHLALSTLGGIVMWNVSSGTSIGRVEDQRMTFGPDPVLFGAKHERRLYTQFGFLDCTGLPQGNSGTKNLETDRSCSEHPENSEGDLDIAPDSLVAIKGHWLGYGLSEDRQWIVLDGKGLLRIPLEYRHRDQRYFYPSRDEVTPVINGCGLAWVTEAGRLIRMNFIERD